MDSFGFGCLGLFELALVCIRLVLIVLGWAVSVVTKLLIVP